MKPITPIVGKLQHVVARSRGFTLIELVVVLALLGLLVSIAAPRYFHIIGNGRDSVQRQNLSTIRDAIDKFHGDVGRYPDTLDELVSRHYLRTLPVDPYTEKPDWVVIAPTDTAQGAVYDVQPSGKPAGVAAAEPEPLPALPASAARN
jgi:general secretion pathway protein G